MNQRRKVSIERNGDEGDQLPEATQRVIARLHAQAWGFAFGLLAGGSLLVATMALVLRGGTDVGKHLGLLAVFFPGYAVTTPGAFIGFVYGFVVGYAIGRTIAVVYNRIARHS